MVASAFPAGNLPHQQGDIGMRRAEISPRNGWRHRIEQAGLAYHSNGEEPVGSEGLWWDESVAWELSSAEVDALEAVTEELHARCLDAVDYLVNRDPTLLKAWFNLPDWFIGAVSESWRRSDPSLMGRMDLAFNPEEERISLLEYNADTPTLCIETAVAQWFWLQDVAPDADQFNSLHEKLLARFQELRTYMDGRGMHFVAYAHMPEEWLHSTYFRDLAEQAGIPTRALDLNELGWDGMSFRDTEGGEVKFLHKLYPWEWAQDDAFGQSLAGSACGVLEPPWKALLSDKAILAILYKLFPDHPNILPAFMGCRGDHEGDWVEKPCLGREGANIRIVKDGHTVEQTTGMYGTPDARWITQQRAKLAAADGWNAVIGSWIVGETAAGIIFREARQSIIQDSSRVVPHFFR